jgi:1-pyrroline-5-carboxylate dehydrogenase
MTSGSESSRSLEERAEPFLRAAELLESGPWRERLVAATMLELSKTVEEAEGDAAAETVDFLRANLANAAEMAAVQPFSPAGVTNHVEYRPLEGFVFAVTPFNFTSMNNLAFGPALLGNTVVWKPAESAPLELSEGESLAVPRGSPPARTLARTGGPEGLVSAVASGRSAPADHLCAGQGDGGPSCSCSHPRPTGADEPNHL